MTAVGKIAFKIAAKLLQIKTWLLWQPIGICPIRLHRRQLSTTYRLATIHALRTERRQTDGQKQLQ